MLERLSEYRLFFRQFLQNYHTTGAILPSGPWLAAALVRHVGRNGGKRRVLEVGPGTGAVTRRIVRHLGPEDRLDLAELNPDFARQLNHSLQTDPALAAVADRTRVLNCAVEELPQQACYEVVISGLPLNNFSVAEVERILEVFRGLLAPGGTLSFFEYIAIRRLRALVSGRRQRQRLRGIGKAMGAVLDGSEIGRESVWPNVPPAWVHHVRFD